MRGFIPSEVKQGDYILGAATSLKGEVLMPDGQWDKGLPAPENQNRGYEPYACVTYAVLNAVEILIRQEYGEVQNLSDRWLAWATGTEAKQGNDPTTVCTFLGKKGDVREEDWPYPTPATDFYKTPPQNLYTLAKEFLAEFEYDNQWVPATPEKMKDALTRSPLTVAGYAWAMNSDGYYYWPDGAQADHYFLIYGYEDGKYWKAFDTYESNFKSLVWDYPFIQIKEHSLSRQVVKQSFFEKFIQYLREALGLDGMSFGAARSPKWREVRRNFLRKHPKCAVCESTKALNVHHKKPFHENPLLELEETNLITLCRDHHFTFGHLGSWRSWNVDVEADSSTWNTKYQTRP